MTETAQLGICDICYDAKRILFSPCTSCLNGRECLNCFLQIIQTSFKCPTCRGPLCPDALREVNDMVDQVEAHTQHTIQRSLRDTVSETITRVRVMRSSAQVSAQVNHELRHVASDLAWMRTMTSSHTNFANRFLPIRPMAQLSLQQTQSPLAVNELNMTPQEMVDAMFPFPPMEEVVIGVVDLTEQSPPARPPVNRRLFPDDPEPDNRNVRARVHDFPDDPEPDNLIDEAIRNVRPRVNDENVTNTQQQNWVPLRVSHTRLTRVRTEDNSED